MTALAWKRDKKLGHVATVDGRKIARIVRLSARAWRWSYRGPGQTLVIHDEARILKHAKAAVEALHASKTGNNPDTQKAATRGGHEHGSRLNTSGGTGERRRATKRSCQETEAGRRDGRAVVETVPGGGGGCKRQGPPSAEIELDAKRVESPPLWGQPLEVESTPKTMCDFREGEKPSGTDGFGPERVRDPHPAVPRGMVPGENPGRSPVCCSHETPGGAAPSSPQLSLLEVPNA